MTIRRAFTAVLYGLAVAGALIWLALGLAPAIASAVPSVHDALHSLGEGGGRFAAFAAGIANSAHGSQPGAQVVFDYLFSAFNLGAGIFILRLRSEDRAARLLALGMIGTAVAFNLQGHDALAVVPAWLLGPVSVWHDLVHVVAGIAYVYALLLFPSGRLLTNNRGIVPVLAVPLVAIATIVVLFAALTSVDDHTLGLVVLFGVVTPAVGIGRQALRAWKGPTASARRQSAVAVKLLLLALAIAAPLILSSTSRSEGGPPSETRLYEFTTPAAGRYFFVCDPHPDDMTGTFDVAPESRADDLSRQIEVTAVQSRFDLDTIVVPPHERIRIDFTNFDADLHNVAVYRDDTRRDPLFIGAEFSGRATAQVAFRTFRTLFAAIPIALFAVLIRFRLWDIDKLVSRTLVYGALVALIGGAYVAVVTLVGEILGGRALHPLLYVVVAGAVALAAQPLRTRVERTADRLVYGRRATPYQVMASFARDMARAVSLEEVLPRMAEAAARGTRARASTVRVFLPGGGERRATWPEAHTEHDLGRAIPITHEGETIGDIRVGGGRDPGRLLQDLASNASLALHNVRLAAELGDRLDELSRQTDELRTSRRRIVAAQDAERRRLERDIHDGAQQQLVALRVRLRLAESVLASSPERAEELIDGLVALARDALENLRALAGGVFPPLLEDRGLVAALEAESGRAGNVEVHAAGEIRHRRVDEHVEQAVYFSCLEALQNAAKHARASLVQIFLTLVDDVLEFAVVDDGEGFDVSRDVSGSGMHNMVDRLGAVGGNLTIDSAPGAGTRVSGRIPLQPRAEAHAPVSASGPNSDLGT